MPAFVPEPAFALSLACGAQAAFVVAFALFKSAAARMPPLSARRPLLAVADILGERRWLGGFAVLMAGFSMADVALLTLPIVTALPAHACSLLLLLGVSARRFGERLTRREGAALLVTVAAMAVAALSLALAPGAPLSVGARPPLAAQPPWWGIALVAVPSLLVPLWLFAARDRLLPGRHARRLTGVAYGIGAGVLLGTAETCGLGMALTARAGRPGVFTSSFLPIFLVAGVLGLGLLSIGLQRCRLTVLATVLTVTAKIHLLLAATLLYGEPWPRDWTAAGVRAAAVLVAVLAVLAFPRYERKPRPAVPPAPAAPARPGYVGRRRRSAQTPVHGIPVQPPAQPSALPQALRDGRWYAGRP
ncbi:hypothetical protein [Actinomadura parmotrematis]|uniref:Integral membrane protein n=1 Tax=Actinomadura parmotrematis TaxID=2864039 RepID=A0ABS7FQX1_9ACTN|nr:hypothetical protein [Actinomadura parmotrematis]MBW8482124.1 hypothetical protein [Actinomadura parmotrematis]